MAVTIKDIATRAGVSRGTVDRVIHNRGNVAPYLKQHIENVITELGYKRNIIASQLVRNKTLNIALVLPHPAEEIYWTLPHLGIEEAVEEYTHLGIKIFPQYFNLAQSASFKNAVNQIQWDEIDAIILAPIYKQESLQFLDTNKAIDKPIICINTDLGNHLDQVYYVGQDSYKSGLLAGKLFDLTIENQSSILMIRIGKQFEDPEHYSKKEQGIRDYFAANVKSISIQSIELHDYSNISYMQEELLTYLDLSAEKHHIFIPNSKAYRLIQIMDTSTLSKTQVIGFDLITENMSELQKGNIHFIINQNPRKQGFLAVKSIINKVILGQDLLKTQYVPLDIIVKENVNQTWH